MENYVATWMPLLVAISATDLGLLAYGLQSAAQRRAKYRAEVQERYEAYLHSIFDVMAKHSDEDRHAEFQKRRVSLRLFASPRVLWLAKRFEDHITGKARDEDPMDTAAGLVNAMREHVLPNKFRDKSKLSDQEMKKLLSFQVNWRGSQ